MPLGSGSRVLRIWRLAQAVPVSGARMLLDFSQGDARGSDGPPGCPGCLLEYDEMGCNQIQMIQ